MGLFRLDRTAALLVQLLLRSVTIRRIPQQVTELYTVPFLLVLHQRLQGISGNGAFVSQHILDNARLQPQMLLPQGILLVRTGIKGDRSFLQPRVLLCNTAEQLIVLPGDLIQPDIVHLCRVRHNQLIGVGQCLGESVQIEQRQQYRGSSKQNQCGDILSPFHVSPP